MGFTLNDLLIGTHRRLGTLNVAVATAAGTTGGTTLVDSDLVTQTKDDQFNGGTVFFIGTSDSAITGAFRTISDYAAATGTFTFSSFATSLGVASGSTYGYTGPEFPTELTVELANDVLRSFGPMTFVDKDTITSSASQEIYTAQLAWKYAPPIRIDLQTYTGSTATINAWRTINDWEYQPSSGGATAQLVFPGGLPSGRKVRVWFQDYHPRITGSTVAIDERIDPDLAITGLVSRFYEYRVRRARSSEPSEVRAWLDNRDLFEKRRAERPIWAKSRARKLLTLGPTEDQSQYLWPST